LILFFANVVLRREIMKCLLGKWNQGIKPIISLDF
ncbi:MAG: hypothetical protein ACI8P3_004366, partial [Saprospiraceae bacterium]